MCAGFEAEGTREALARVGTESFGARSRLLALPLRANASALR